MNIPKNKYFITGTDTSVGKTYVTCHLLDTFNQQGYSTAAIKPVASGSEWIQGSWRNEDALLLQQHTSVQLDYSEVNPFALKEATSPHLAAQFSGPEPTISAILQKMQPVLQQSIDYILVEGVGGWLVPINQKETMADVAHALNFPVILVVGLRLGCFNHTLLTYRSIQSSGLTLAGWIANRIDPAMEYVDDYIQSLQTYLSAPLLADIPFVHVPDKIK